MGWENLSGTELQPHAMQIAADRVPNVNLKVGSALDLPWPDRSFDLVFTSGVLIHISPDDLGSAMDEIHRTTRQYIWGFEYYSPAPAEVRYRGQSGLLWKMDFAQKYLDRFQDLMLIKEQRLPYLQNSNVDTVFLLKKT